MPHFDLDLAITTQNNLAPNARFYFALTIGGPAEVITDYNGTVLPYLQSHPINATTPQFMHATANSGYITDGKSVYRYVFSLEARDATPANASAQAAASAAASSAAAAIAAAGASLGQAGIYAWTFSTTTSAYRALPATVPSGVAMVIQAGPYQSPPPSTGPWASLPYLYILAPGTPGA